MRLKLVFALFATALLQAAFAQVTPPKFVPGQVIVKFKPSTPVTTMQSVHSRVGSQILKENATLKFQTVKLRTGYAIASAVSYYKSSPYVLYAHGNAIHSKRLDVNDPMRAQQGSLSRMKVYQGWDLETGLSMVKIAVIDTGIDMTHPDLASKIVDPYDQENGDNFPQDGDIHGTHVSGLAAAATNNFIGIAGVGFNAKIMPIRFDFTIGGSAESIVRAAQKGAKVINMSYGSYSAYQAEQEAVAYAWSKGVVLVAAAGNDNQTQVGYPAGYPEVISVGATLTSADTRAVFSNYGNDVDVTAPGDGATPYSGVLSTLPGGTYGSLSGTSMASPNVAGVVGLLWSRTYNSVSNSVIKDALLTWTDPLAPGIAVYGRVNAALALAHVPHYIPITDTPAPAFISVVEGSPVGASNQVLTDDGVYFGIQPTTLTSVGKVASTSYRFVLPAPAEQILSFKVTVNSRFGPGATGQIFLLNVNTSKWEHVKSYPVGSSDVTGSITVRADRLKFADADDEVEVLVRGVVPSAYAAGVVDPYNIDFISLETTYLTEIP